MKIYNVINKINGLGNNDFDYEAIYQSGYSAGHESGYTDGLEKCEEEHYKNLPLTFEIISGGTICWKCSADPSFHPERTIEYNINGGEWSSITSTWEGTRLNVEAGDIVQFKANYEEYGAPGKFSQFCGTTATYIVYGNIMSLIKGDNYATADTFTERGVFYGLFRNNMGLLDAYNLVLPATNLTDRCYANMFFNCNNLERGPKEVPDANLIWDDGGYEAIAYGSFEGMFGLCSNLVVAPILKQKVLGSGGYYASMFTGCSKLNHIVCLATDIEDQDSPGSFTNCRYWTSGVAATGTFVKNQDMNDWPSGTSGIPDGWTVVDAVL